MGGFDHVFNPSHNQADVWEATEPLVQSCIDGHNVCLFAYGQTGSGKTYTMLGSNNNPGIISRSVKKIFDYKRHIETEETDTFVELKLNLVEIYNESVLDLLPHTASKSKKHDLKLNSNEAIGGISLSVSSESEVLNILDRAISNRCVKTTNSNNDIMRKGKLNICDLAGSERLTKSESIGSTRKETQYINKSLSTLSNVIEKLQENSSHIPFRESKLTYLLKNSLGGDSKTLCIICCNPMPDHFQEGLCSLRFASKVNKVELKSLKGFN